VKDSWRLGGAEATAWHSRSRRSVSAPCGKRKKGCKVFFFSFNTTCWRVIEPVLGASNCRILSKSKAQEPQAQLAPYTVNVNRKAPVPEGQAQH